MILKAEVMENGYLRVTAPELKVGDEILLETKDNGIRNADKGKWSEMKKIFEEIDKMDFPRRTNEEILRDLHEMRG